MAIEIVLEIETVMSNIANSLDPDGVRAREMTRCLKRDVDEELGHARRLGDRIEQRYGVAPGWLELVGGSYVQPPERPTGPSDIVRAIRVVIETETRAIERYGRIIDLCGGEDALTREMVANVLHDEEARRRQFETFLREFEAERPT